MNHLLGQERTGHYRFRTGDQALVRRINLSVIMHHLRESAPISRADLAGITGLNKTTVSSLVRELIDRQFVREVGFEAPGSRRGVGRLAVLLELDPTAGYVVSAEIGVDFLLVICANFAPEIIWRFKENINPDMGQQVIFDRLLALIVKAISIGCETCKTLLGVAIGVPGLVDQANGTLLFAPNLRWENVDLRVILREFIRGPLFVDNEANMAALGEHYFGAAQGYDEVLYISAGVGLGGGIVHAGDIYGGVSSWRRVRAYDDGPRGDLCNCGNRGCWETQVSQRALFQYLRRGVGRGRPSLLEDMTGGNLGSLTVPMVVEAAQAGDGLALEALEVLGHHLGIGIASLINGLNPELVVLGGILSLAGDFLLPAIEDELSHRALRWNRNAAQVVLARHGIDACVMGGVARIFQAILAEPVHIVRQSAWMLTAENS
jgi:predicted NBD/HSP70 family sugar kinase